MQSKTGLSRRFNQPNPKEWSILRNSRGKADGTLNN